MQPFDLSALSAALPPDTQIIVSGGAANRAELRIGNPVKLELPNDAEPWGESTTTTRVTGLDDRGRHTTEDVAATRWPAGVCSAEEMVAFTYCTVMLQQDIGAAAYAAAEAAGTLPAWKPGAALTP